MIIDIFTDSKYSYLYPDGAPRPQPSDFVVEFFKDKKDGIFIDVGASDGLTWSNSLTLEVNYNWTGLCIEPHPSAFKKLIECRTNKCLNCAVSKTEGVVDFLVIEGYAEMLSGLVDCYDQRHVERIRREVDTHGDKINVVKIDSIPLTKILNSNNIKRVDYLSVDTEGSEISVMDSIDLSQLDINLISLECNYDLEELNSYMNNKGYKFLQKICCDAFYTKK
jgi:FkbM family methyltransferase